MPNLLSLRPVEMYGWVLASTSGLTRSDTGARLPSFAGDLFKRSSSASDSTLKQRMPDVEGACASPRRSCRRRRTRPCRVTAGAQHALQFAAGDDIEAGAEARQQIQHRQVGIGLDRIADQVRTSAPKARVEGAAMALDASRENRHSRGVPKLRGDLGQRHVFRVQAARRGAEKVPCGQLLCRCGRQVEFASARQPPENSRPADSRPAAGTAAKAEVETERDTVVDVSA